MDKSSKSLSLLLEEWGPTVISAIVLATIHIFSDYLTSNFGSKEWDSEGLYSAIFDWSAIQTGFAFGVYGFVVGKSDGFVEKIRGTIAMDRFMSYIRRANIAGFILTISSIPLIVITPDISQPWSWELIVVSVWFSLFSWSFLAFLRLAYTFGHLASAKDKQFHGA